jgi:hypothetical protein
VRIRGTAFGGLSLGLGACAYYGAELLSGVPAPDGGDAMAGNGGSVAACEHALPPPKPAVVDGGGQLELVFAIKEVSFGYTVDGGLEAIGYDIDKVCTCQGQENSCEVPAWASASHCDGPQGRDNAAGQLLGELDSLMPGTGQGEWNEQINAGSWSVLLRVRDYNGQDDDDQVELAWYVADAFHAIIVQQDGGKPNPKWDGADQWPVLSTSVHEVPAADGGVAYDPSRPKVIDPLAYVAGGVLVGMLPSGTLPANVTVQMELTEPYVTARIVKSGALWELQDGNIAGVWTLTDIFEQVSYMNLLGSPVCTGTALYAGVKSMVCKHADIYHKRGSASATCDALSLGMGFRALQAGVGGVTDAKPMEKKCKPEEDPAQDMCGQP